MKKLFRYLALPLVAMTALAACDDEEEIVFDHERQAFSTQSGKLLLEVIMPQATAVDEEIYIIGDFNGGEQAIGNPSYLMSHSDVVPQKWGIYIDPNAFQGGRTLRDGFTFYSVQQGLERSPLNEDVSHTTTIGTGEWTNVYVDRWAKYFEPVEPSGKIVLPDHPGTYRIYAVNEIGWPDMALYMYGDVNNLGGGWPGIPISGTFDAGGTPLWYFDVDQAEAAGNTEHLIFNNNGGGEQIAGAAEPVVTFGNQVDYIYVISSINDVKEITVDDLGGGGDPWEEFTQTSTWSVIGSIASTGNNWNGDEPMVTNGTWHAARGLVLTTGDDFKFRKDADWGTNFGGAFTGFGQKFEAVKDGENIRLPEDGTFDLFLNPDAKLIMIIHTGDPFNLDDSPTPPTPPTPDENDPVTAVPYQSEETRYDPHHEHDHGHFNVRHRYDLDACPLLHDYRSNL